jgi:hypothetical protein
VHVQIDESWHQVHSGGVDLLVRVLRRPVRAQRQARRSRRPHRCDAVAFYDDIHRPLRRRPSAIDQHDATDHQRLEGAFSLVGSPGAGWNQPFAGLRLLPLSRLRRRRGLLRLVSHDDSGKRDSTGDDQSGARQPR